MSMDTDRLNSALMKGDKAGQVFTPRDLATTVVHRGLSVSKVPPTLILDPAVGPGVFIDVVQQLGIGPDVTLVGYDLDLSMVELARVTMDRLNVRGEIRHSDYLLDRCVPSPHLVVMNPPYVRHELIDPSLKTEYAAIVHGLTGTRVPKRANLFVYFLLKAVGDVLPGGIVSAIVYDAVTRTDYGKRFLEELDHTGEILSIEPAVAPFQNVLVNAEIIVIRKRLTPFRRQVSKGPVLPPRHVLLGDLVTVSRGTALLNSRVFLASKTDPYFSEASPFVKRQRLLLGVVVPPDHGERAYLFPDPKVIPLAVADWLRAKTDSIIRSRSRRTKGLEVAVNTESAGWLTHRVVTGPLLMNYYFRSPPRHIFNPAMLPAADNFLCVQPKDIEEEAALALMNSSAWRRALVKAGRSQGNGLMKLQVYEYRSAVVPDWRLIPPSALQSLTALGVQMARAGKAWTDVIPAVDEIVRRTFPHADV